VAGVTLKLGTLGSQQQWMETLHWQTQHFRQEHSEAQILMKMTMTMAMKMESKTMEMTFPTGSGRDSLDLHDLMLEQKPVALKVSEREEESFEIFEEFFWRNLQEPQAHSFDELHGAQVSAMCEQFEGGVEGDPGLVRHDMQSSWEGLPAGHDVEGNEAASGRRLKTSSKFLILLNYLLWVLSFKL